jgi:hypothetical protein
MIGMVALGTTGLPAAATDARRARLIAAVVIAVRTATGHLAGAAVRATPRTTPLVWATHTALWTSHAATEILLFLFLFLLLPLSDDLSGTGIKP